MAEYEFDVLSLRQHLGLTQQQLADQLGVSFATVNRWEGGAIPQRAQRKKLAALAGESNGDPAVVITPKRRRNRHGSQATTNKPMEQMLWDAACSIRGEKDAAKFKDYLLPLLFLKRLSDVFDDEIDRLAEGGDRTVALAQAESDHELVRFYLPPVARWGVISGRDPWPLEEKQPDIGEHLTLAVRAVARQNPELAGVIDVEDFAAERNGERDVNPAKLRGIIEVFSDPRYRLGLADVEPDFLGRCYEYLLRKFAEGSGQSAGEFFTPTNVGLLMAHILRPRPGESCHDYACGSGGLLIKAQIVARELDPLSKTPLKLYGQELQAESFAIAKMNAIIHDMPQLQMARGDSMLNPKWTNGDGSLQTFDIVIANPMWNQGIDPKSYESDAFDRFRRAGGPTAGKADWAWLQHTLACMSDRGRAAIVLDTGAVTRGSNSKNEDRERNIRKWFVDNDLVDGVILLPENLFYNTTAAGIIIVLNKNKTVARKGKIVFVNASKRFEKGRPKNFLPDDAIKTIALEFISGNAGDSHVAQIDCKQIAEADYNLSPSRWAANEYSSDERPVSELLVDLLGAIEEDQKALETLKRLLAPLVEAESVMKADVTSWDTVSVGDCLQPLSLTGLEKVQTRDYKEFGAFPVVDQGASEIAGWTDNQQAVVRDHLPVVVFGDHTRALKYIDRPFARGADGTQILKPKDEIDTLFFYFACRAINLEAKGYARHFSELKESTIRLPSDRSQQRLIAQALLAVERASKTADRRRAILDQMFKALLSGFMNGEIDVNKLDLGELGATA